MSVTSRNLLSLAELIGFFFAGSQPRGQEEKAALAAAICWFAKVLREIERGVIGLPFVIHCDRLLLNRNARDVFLVKVLRRTELRVLEFAFGLANEMVDLSCSNARNFKFDRPQSACTDRQFPVAVQRQQTALTFNLHFAWQLR